VPPQHRTLPIPVGEFLPPVLPAAGAAISALEPSHDVPTSVALVLALLVVASGLFLVGVARATAR